MKKLLLQIIVLSFCLASCGGLNITENVRRCFMLPTESCCDLEINNESESNVKVNFDGADVMNVSFTAGELEGMTKTVTANCVRSALGELTVEDCIMNEPLVLLRKAFLFFGTQEYNSDGEVTQYDFSDGDICYTLYFDTVNSRPECISVTDKTNEVKINYIY